ncbi:hypothetical protein Q5P01_000957 [Channa striata]|uniref:Uncharacterized protein n=1 Tax=Channa striata TaxID=64152 RepID=A0AA88IG51_CHASR|nr:hypothetical protein Q5P01_000957 [Channa striata]
MKTLFLLFLFCHVSSPVKHSLKFLLTVSSGVQNLPEFVMSVVVNDVQAVHCDSNKTIELHQDVSKKLFTDNPQLMELLTGQCFMILPRYFKSILDTIMQRFSHRGGVHIVEFVAGIQSDEQTGDTVFAQCVAEDVFKLWGELLVENRSPLSVPPPDVSVLSSQLPRYRFLP